MELHRGRLIDHVHLVVKDIEASRRFYAAVMKALGIPPGLSGPTFFGYDELYVSTKEMSATEQLTGRVHLAFSTRDKALVEKAYKAGLAAGGKDNGPPGERPYHPGYYAAFLLDPDGNNIEIVFHGPAAYSAESSAGGGGARNSSAVVNTKGVTVAQCGSWATRYIGPVGRHLPSAELPSSATKSRYPSLARMASTASAMDWPSAMPADLAALSGTVDRLVARAASRPAR